MASGLGVEKSEVKSPGFVFLHVYNGKSPVYHFDLYRLCSPRDLSGIGFDEFVWDAGAVSVVEWAERAADALPEDRLNIRFIDLGGTKRKIIVTPQGERSRRILKWFSRK